MMKSVNMKRLFGLLLCVALVMTAVGCGGDPSSSSEVTSDLSSGDQLPDSTTSVASTTTGTSTTVGGSTEATKTTTKKTEATKKPTVQSTGVSPLVNKTLAPMTSENTEILLENPDRGFRWEIHMDIGAISEESNFDRMKAAARRYFKTMTKPDFPVKLVQVYIEITKWRQSDLTDKGLQAVDAVLTAGAELGYKMLARVSYITNWEKSMEEYAEADVMMRHVDQLAPIIKKHKDNIFVVQAGFYGAWGEWHSNGKAFDDATLTQLVNKIGNAFLTEDMYMMVRLPYYKNMIPTGSVLYKRTGIHKDNFFGKNQNKNGEIETNAAMSFWDGTASWKQLTAEAAYTPQDGETFWEDDLHKSEDWADGFESILQMYEHRYSCFSGLHGNYDWGNRSDTTMGRWRKQNITYDWLAKNKVIGSPNWFLDENGNKVTRNTYEFIMHHLGYYVEAKSVKTSGGSKAGEKLQISMPLVNHGFAAAFNMNSGFAILDANNNVVSTVTAGDPETWYNRSATNPSDSKQLTHTISAQLKLPNKAGTYKLAFYLRNNRGDYAYIANQVETVNGYQVLHTFTV